MTLAYLGDSGIVLLGGDERFQYDDQGVRWQWNGRTPWGASPAPRTSTGDNATDHGSWDATQFYGALSFPLEGYAYAPDHTGLHDAQARLRAACGLAPVAFRVVEPGFDRQASFRLDGQFLWDEITPTLGKFSVPLWAKDPRSYSPDLHTAIAGFPSSVGGLTWPATWPATWAATVVSGSASLTNEGTETAWPVFRIDGPVTSPYVVNDATGEAMHLDLELAAGEWVTIDTRTHQVLANGDPAASRRDKWWGDWFGIPSQSDLRVDFNGAAAGDGAQLTATWRDTWI